MSRVDFFVPGWNRSGRDSVVGAPFDVASLPQRTAATLRPNFTGREQVPRVPRLPPLQPHPLHRVVRRLPPGHTPLHQHAAVTMPTCCARCHAPATHTARRHRVTIPMCQAHHRHVWAGLVADGWIISPITTSASTPIIWGNSGPELYAPR